MTDYFKVQAVAAEYGLDYNKFAAAIRALSAPGEAAAGITCARCKGSGEGTVQVGIGPDAYDAPVMCEACGGSGAFDGTEPLRSFPTMLRKMWSGGDVQRWIDENIAPAYAAVCTLANRPLYTQPAASDAGVSDRFRRELENIVNTKRFDRSTFRDDTEFADWAQSRARHCLRAAALAPGQDGWTMLNSDGCGTMHRVSAPTPAADQPGGEARTREWLEDASEDAWKAAQAGGVWVPREAAFEDAWRARGINDPTERGDAYGWWNLGYRAAGLAPPATGRVGVTVDDGLLSHLKEIAAQSGGDTLMALSRHTFNRILAALEAAGPVVAGVVDYELADCAAAWEGAANYHKERAEHFRAALVRVEAMLAAAPQDGGA